MGETGKDPINKQMCTVMSACDECSGEKQQGEGLERGTASGSEVGTATLSGQVEKAAL